MASQSTSSEGHAGGFQQYCNTAQFSDITIRFGVQGERKFHGHKIILCSRSSWFKAALSGNFKEGQESQILLQDDDPDALQTVLEKSYYSMFPILTLDDELGRPLATKESILQYLDILRVADKYDFQGIYSQVIMQLGYHWADYLSKATVGDAQKTEYASDVLEIIRQLYALAPKPFRRVRDIVLDLLCTDKVRRKDLAALVKDVSKEHAQFGRDVLMRFLEVVMDNESTKDRALAVTEQVQCFTCDDKWMRPVSDDENDEGYCWNCGHYISDEDVI